MIARIWVGHTARQRADDYVEYLLRTGVEGFRSTAGNRGSWVLRRIDDDEAEFMVISLWDSMESIRLFVGDDVEKARYYREDPEYLLELPTNVVHYEVAYGHQDQH